MSIALLAVGIIVFLYGCSTLEVFRTTLNENSQWKEAGENAVS